MLPPNKPMEVGGQLLALQSVVEELLDTQKRALGVQTKIADILTDMIQKDRRDDLDDVTRQIKAHGLKVRG